MERQEPTDILKAFREAELQAAIKQNAGKPVVSVDDEVRFIEVPAVQVDEKYVEFMADKL